LKKCFILKAKAQFACLTTVRVLAETIAAVDAGRVTVGERETERVLERNQDTMLIPA